MRVLVPAALVVAALALQGCATKTYGRQGTLTDFERQSLGCREIDLAVAQVDGFVARVNSESQFSGKDVLAILGDFGIGNNMERSAALQSAHARKAELIGLKSSKGCTAEALKAPREPDRPAVVAVPVPPVAVAPAPGALPLPMTPDEARAEIARVYALGQRGEIGEGEYNRRMEEATRALK